MAIDFSDFVQRQSLREVTCEGLPHLWQLRPSCRGAAAVGLYTNDRLRGDIAAQQEVPRSGRGRVFRGPRFPWLAADRRAASGFRACLKIWKRTRQASKARIVRGQAISCDALFLSGRPSQKMGDASTQLTSTSQPSTQADAQSEALQGAGTRQPTSTCASRLATRDAPGGAAVRW